MLRVVLDTNIIVSSVLSKTGIPARAMDAWREMKFALVISPAIMAEVRATLNYPRIRKKYALGDFLIAELTELFELHALWVEGETDVSGSLLVDQKDEVFLAAAVEAQADLIVSGDHHLLELGAYADIPIITVRQFLERVAVE
jgi:putative PIN family toxin of toxin-antitoxin system